MKEAAAEPKSQSKNGDSNVTNMQILSSDLFVNPGFSDANRD